MDGQAWGRERGIERNSARQDHFGPARALAGHQSWLDFPTAGGNSALLFAYGSPGENARRYSQGGWPVLLHRDHRNSDALLAHQRDEHSAPAPDGSPHRFPDHGTKISGWSKRPLPQSIVSYGLGEEYNR